MIKMTVTIKIDDAKKQKLDRFLAQLLLKEGKKMTIQEAVGLMIDHTLENENEFIENLKNLPPVEEDPLWKMMKNARALGIKDLSTSINAVLYGSPS
jgi:hypothetical protein